MPTKGSTTERGYGHEHRKLRAQVKLHVDAGQAHCWRCGQWLDPAEPWDLGHDPADRTIYRGPECIPCNRATNTQSKAADFDDSRDW